MLRPIIVICLLLTSFSRTAALTSSSTQAPSSSAARSQHDGTSEKTRVHITSTPSGGEIYVDGKFSGSTPSEIALPQGAHVVKVTLDGKEWSRTVEITSGEINIHAELPPEAATDERAKVQAAESLRALAQTIKQCPQEVLRNERWGKGSTEVDQLVAGPPENLVWDVGKSDSARSPYSGYIEFVIHFGLSVPPESSEKFMEKHRGLWEFYAKQPLTEYRYDFDIGPDRLQLTRVRYRDEGQTDWKSGVSAYCWGKAAQAAQTAPGTAKHE